MAASRAIFAFSRDNAMPLSFLWRKVTKKEKIPRNASWLVAFLASCLGLPVFGYPLLFLPIPSYSFLILFVPSYSFLIIKLNPEGISFLEDLLNFCPPFPLPPPSSNVAFLAIVSVATVAWVGTYAVPIFFRLTMREADFKAGPFSLGMASKPMCVVSLVYILYTMAIFMAPNIFPVTCQNLNYGPIGKTLLFPGGIMEGQRVCHVS